jgi:RHS repeat-associated protein
VTYLHTDHLNSPRLATNDTGTVIWRWESTAFGETQPNEDPDGDGTTTTINLRFPGQYYDQESGLQYNWHRYYDPKIGRYVTSDPIGLRGGFNTYAYVENSPVTWIDPYGLLGYTPPGDDNRRGGIPGYGLPAWSGGVSGGAGGSFNFGSEGASYDSGFAVDGFGNRCFYSSICERKGIGFQGSLNPVTLRGRNSRLCSGTYFTNGIFWNFGAGLIASGNISYGDGTISGGRGFSFGLGGGIAAGTQTCMVTLICSDDDPCACKNTQ